MVRGTAVLREGLNWAREAARRVVSGICVADESRVFTIPATSYPTRTLSRSIEMTSNHLVAQTAARATMPTLWWHAPAILALRL